MLRRVVMMTISMGIITIFFARRMGTLAKAPAPYMKYRLMVPNTTFTSRFTNSSATSRRANQPLRPNSRPSFSCRMP